MAESDPTSGPVTFGDADARADQMHQAIDQWLSELVDAVDEARASDEFQRWLDVHSQFHDYSHRNTLLISLQCPEATKVAGYRTWQDEFDRQVQDGESAIWIWAPLLSRQCPECGNSPSYHADSDCAYDETPPEEWNEGVVGFKPVPVFDVSQTEGKPLPELETDAAGEADELLAGLLAAADALGVTVDVVGADAWGHGDADGVCRHVDGTPHIQVQQADPAAVAGTLIHEYAHALLHDPADTADREARELEAEAVAYVVGRHCGLEMDGSALYLAAWSDDDADQLFERCERIRETSTTVIKAIADQSGSTLHG
ncbi:LtrC-like protein [Halorubrum kocurii]|uniref:LtrC-like protein n=1 Tax=Halorubrum kocurii JCM 14978 TaxID=1230456 RepID=M0NK25_9EURY|nr:LtrC-like protein [Halorubrum kocurii]EMA57000.1 LtrC-like protein [Halorubrum kocurii JCM 14978]